ncbi:aminoglycoside adenylyltransferase domain-containing protein [Actinoplanes aureus]|uniref:DUF4111 domain-containing protein n=1 Tax=Actinoplanes aureus TaxID=2792083 RepID=A0A931FZ48_9ACTN|nr:aminoglycoside adenylyltransferase domain-containing protein [Actinoplanes aureus]MBG0564372.1 DUF4111 domain-containing protein [Actinoplanes aureus]
MTRTAAEALAGGCAGIARGATRSVILHGSLAAGGFLPGRSDIDLLVVVDDGLTDAQASDLKQLVRKADTGDAAGIDLHVVTAEVAGAPTRTPALELHVGRYDGTSAGFEVERRLAEAPDLLAELSMAREQGLHLAGAAPRTVIGPVPAGWVVDRGRYWLRSWQSLTDDSENAAFMVLTACRIWRFAIEHVHCSKVEAARWALTRNPSLKVVEQAMQRYLGDLAVPVDEQNLAALLDLVLRETAIRRPLG